MARKKWTLLRASDIDDLYDEETKRYALEHRMYWRDIFHYFNTPRCTYKLGELVREYVENGLISLPKSDIDQICAFVARRIEKYDPEAVTGTFYQPYLQIRVSQEIESKLIFDLTCKTVER